jgi:uracil phosphoribosyltransferase
MPGRLTIVDHPLVLHKLTLMRDRETSTAGFRQLLREISLLLAYEITRDLPLTSKTVETPLAEMEAPVLKGKKLALISILRAGNGLLDGVLELVPSARVGFVGLYRDEATLQPVKYYSKVPADLDERVTIVLDPMLATGNSSVAAVDLLKEAAPPTSASSACSPPPRASGGCRTPTRTCRSSPPPSTASSTTRATSCPAWATPATGCSGRSRRLVGKRPPSRCVSACGHGIKSLN